MFFQCASLETAGLGSSGISRFFMTAQPSTNSTSLQQAPSSRDGCATWGHSQHPVSVTYLNWVPPVYCWHWQKGSSQKLSPNLHPAKWNCSAQMICLRQHCSFCLAMTNSGFVWALPFCSTVSSKQLYPPLLSSPLSLTEYAISPISWQTHLVSKPQPHF